MNEGTTSSTGSLPLAELQRLFDQYAPLMAHRRHKVMFRVSDMVPSDKPILIFESSFQRGEWFVVMCDVTYQLVKRETFFDSISDTELGQILVEMMLRKHTANRP